MGTPVLKIIFAVPSKIYNTLSIITAATTDLRSSLFFFFFFFSWVDLVSFSQEGLEAGELVALTVHACTVLDKI